MQKGVVAVNPFSDAPPPSPPPPPYSSLKEVFKIDCMIENGSTNQNECMSGSNDYTWGDYPGTSAEGNETWETAKAMYNMYKGIEEMSAAAALSEGTTAWMDLISGDMVTVSDDQSTAEQYEKGVVSTFDGLLGQTGMGAYSAVNQFETNLGYVKSLGNALPGWAKNTLMRGDRYCDSDFKCDHQAITDSFVNLAQNKFRGSAYSENFDDVVQMNDRYAAQQSLPGVKGLYNYLGMTDVFTDDDTRHKMKEAGITSSSFAKDWSDGEVLSQEYSKRMFTTMTTDDSAVRAFQNGNNANWQHGNYMAEKGADAWEANHIASGNYWSKGGSLADATQSKSFWVAEFVDMMVDVKETTQTMIKSWQNFKADGHFGGSVKQALAQEARWTSSQASASLGCTREIGSGSTACSRGATWGCSGMPLVDLEALNSPLPYWSDLKCKDGFKKDGSFDMDLVYPHHHSNSIGGVFFSQNLGGYESYSIFLPPKYCMLAAGGSAMGSQSTSDGKSTRINKTTFEYVFMLHGWGGHCDFIDGLGMVMTEVFQVCGKDSDIANLFDFTFSTCGKSVAVAPNGFVVLSPEDGSTPIGTKTWYQNSVFSGRHAHFITTDLPAIIETVLGVSARAKGCFGFSQGGVGSMLVSMGVNTFNAIATFNAPLMPSECFFNNECHQNCGIDFMLCELLWSTILIAWFPYVTMKNGYPIHTTGPMDPVAQGECFNLLQSYSKSTPGARCITYKNKKGESEALAWQYVMKKLPGTLPRLYTNSENWPLPAWYDDGGKLVDTFFYLDPELFTMSTQHFQPTHNILTNMPFYARWVDFLEMVPFFRLWDQPSAYYGLRQFLIFSCDTNDQFNLARLHDGYSNLVSSVLIKPFQGLWVYDVPDLLNAELGHGHEYDLHDCFVTLEWMSDVFRSWAKPNSDVANSGSKRFGGSDDLFGYASTWNENSDSNGKMNTAQMCFGHHVIIKQSSKATGTAVSMPSSAVRLCANMPTTPVEMSVSDDVLAYVNGALQHAHIPVDLDEYVEHKGATLDVYTCFVGDSNPMKDKIGQTTSIITQIGECAMNGAGEIGCDMVNLYGAQQIKDRDGGLVAISGNPSCSSGYCASRADVYKECNAAWNAQCSSLYGGAEGCNAPMM